MHFQFMNYMTTPQPRKPCPGGHEIYNFGRLVLGHHYYTLSLYGLFPGEERKGFKEIHQFTLFTPKLPTLGGREVMKFTISCRLTLQMLHTKFAQNWPSSSWEEDVNGWRTTHDDGNRSPEWIRWHKNARKTWDPKALVVTCVWESKLNSIQKGSYLHNNSPVIA